jgi:hypothetical protein
LEEAVLRWKIVSFNSMNDAETYYLEKMKKKVSFWHVFCFHRKRRPNWTPYPKVIVPFTEAMLALIA